MLRYKHLTIAHVKQAHQIFDKKLTKVKISNCGDFHSKIRGIKKSHRDSCDMIVYLLKKKKV